jgi:hypothetical protein
VSYDVVAAPDETYRACQHGFGTNMSIPQTVALVVPRFRIRPATLGTVFGILVAIAVSSVMLGLTSANHVTAISPVTASEATSSTRPQARYLGPRQIRAELGRPTTIGRRTNAPGRKQ